MSPSDLADLIAWVRHMDPGFGVIQCWPGQGRLLAEGLAAALDGVVVAPEVMERADTGAWTLIPGLPDPASLRRLNGRRDLLAGRGLRVVFLLDEAQWVGFLRDAPDIAAALVLDQRAAYLPQPVDEQEALSAYRAWLLRRHGRLDLRGFARSEQEDVSFEVVRIHQALTLRPSGARRARRYAQMAASTLPAWLATEPAGHLSVVLGHPGSGKSFTLRWLALSEDARREAFPDAGEPPLGLLASLASYAQQRPGTDLFDHLRAELLAEGLELGHCLESLAEAGRVLFLLDGLDEAGDSSRRGRTAEAVIELRRRYPHCTMVVTSRVTGYDDAPLPGAPLQLEPLRERQVQAFLMAWSALYAEERLGQGEEARTLGEREGRRLAAEVLAHEQVRSLATSPLMLTVVAMVQRAGLHLPDHRVELYDHATRILVERWNRVRGLASGGRLPPIKAADAVRLLGPLALETVIARQNPLVSEGDLRRVLGRILDSGQLRVSLTVDEALHLFRDELGLLVEQGPGLWAFLHLTLAEYFAAWQLVRSDALEQLCVDPRRALSPGYTEVLLLAAGELGINRADDQRLRAMVRALLGTAACKSGRPSIVVPALLAGLLADDPALSTALGQEIVEALVPRWWFDARYGRTRFPGLVRESARVAPRILAGRHGAALREALQQRLVDRASAPVLANLGAAGPRTLEEMVKLLRSADLDPGPLLVRALEARGTTAQTAWNAWVFDGNLGPDGLQISIPAEFPDLLGDGQDWGLLVRVKERVRLSFGNFFLLRPVLEYPSSAFVVQEPRDGWLSLVVANPKLDEERYPFGPVVGRLQSLLPP
ncbi:MAG: NACHT domain-containing protein [Pseudomonadota bacterium]